MAELTVPQVDFSSLGQLPQLYKQGQADARRQQTLASLGQGGDVDAQALLKSGDLSLAQLGVQLQNKQVEEAWRKQEATRSQQNADRSYGLQVRAANRADDPTPAGFQKGEDGALAPIPGGPQDPAYIAKTTEVRTKPRQFSVSDISKLSEEGGKFSSVAGFSDSFKPEYAGYKVKALGEAANLAGRTLPESVVGKDIAAGADWWQGYDRYKNVIRNDLYGSALTKSEIQAFEAADITPGMEPAQISKNLARQKAVIENGARRKANAMISSGYDPKAISEAYGIDLGSIGVEGKARKPAPDGLSGDSVLASSAPQDPRFPPPPKLGEMRGGYRFKGGNPGDPVSWVKASN